METYSLLNADRDRAPFLLNDSTRHQFWMITEYDHVLEALQLPEVFGNEVLSALTPKHTFDLLPNYLNPPEHTAMRRVLNRWFSPAAVRHMEPLVLSHCNELLDELAPKGECDLVSEFAIRFPTDMFLATLNLPISDGEEFLVSVEKIFKAFAGQEMAEAGRAIEWMQPELWPKAVEEFIRLYPLVCQDGRLVKQDIDFHGLQLRKGDIVWLGLGSANHDPKKFAEPRSFDLDRDQLNHHLAFGAGIHRGLGMHLARHELVIAVTEWHKRIPDYTLASGRPLYERGAQLTINELPLRWEA
jgi:cytochrome P450